MCLVLPELGRWCGGGGRGGGRDDEWLGGGGGQQPRQEDPARGHAARPPSHTTQGTHNTLVFAVAIYGILKVIAAEEIPAK